MSAFPTMKRTTFVMSVRRLIVRAIFPVSLLSSSLSLWAQATRPAAETTSAVKPPTEAVVLSPFEVSSERDSGFVAASAFSGGRLASELRDTPVSYSIITREFIDALNLTDLQSAADWNTSSTVAVDNGQQNFFFSPV